MMVNQIEGKKEKKTSGGCIVTVGETQVAQARKRDKKLEAKMTAKKQ